MQPIENTIRADFMPSGVKSDVSQEAILAAMIDFLEHYGVASLLGRHFADIIGTGSGREKFNNLLKAADYVNNPDGFCGELVEKLARAGGRDGTKIEINGVELPYRFLMAALETAAPGGAFTSIKSVGQLDELANLETPPEQREALEEVLADYPVRLSDHVIRQMRLSKDVAYQYLPFVEELDPVGHVNTWIGQFHQGLLEQMYQNRVIFLLNMSCPVYCRFCFRKHKESRNQGNPTLADVKRAVEYVGKVDTIKEIVITGGDPLMSRDNVACAVDGLLEVPHVQTLRLATRSVAYYPNLFYNDDSWLLKYLKAASYRAQLKNKRIELATHFIHPDEVSPESLDLITDLVNHGVSVYVQTPFLKDCNDQGPELVELFSLLRGAGAELHYIYIPCSPIHGNSVYWTQLSKGIEAAHYLRAHLSDRIIPRLCTATPIGKLDWNSSGWAVGPDDENDNFLWLRSPYTPDYFKEFAPLAKDLDFLKVNEEGTIDVRYMAEIGDESLYMGHRRPTEPKPARTDRSALEELQARAAADWHIDHSIVETGTAGLYRLHKTRIALNLDEFEGDYTYIANNIELTDVVLTSGEDATDRLYAVGRVIDALKTMPHVNAVRLRSLNFNYHPKAYTRAVINRLGELNKLTVVEPLRLEVETMFLHSSEVLPEHRVLAEKLRNKGVTVYCNTPLLADINDSAEEINHLAYKLREAGIEFHHLYAAGLPIQAQRGTACPVRVAEVIDIATTVRREGSGREIPRYIVLTELGEVDFGLTGRLYNREGRLWVRLSPYSLEYFQAMQPDFSWPADVEIDQDGRPILPVIGLTDHEGFMVF